MYCEWWENLFLVFTIVVALICAATLVMLFGSGIVALEVPWSFPVICITILLFCLAYVVFRFFKFRSDKRSERRSWAESVRIDACDDRELIEQLAYGFLTQYAKGSEFRFQDKAAQPFLQAVALYIGHFGATLNGSFLREAISRAKGAVRENHNAACLQLTLLVPASGDHTGRLCANLAGVGEKHSFVGPYVWGLDG